MTGNMYGKIEIEGQITRICFEDETKEKRKNKKGGSCRLRILF